jgi:hypothetical protein
MPLAALLGALAGFALSKRNPSTRLLVLMDSAASSHFARAGASRALNHGLTAGKAVVVGAITALGGGALLLVLGLGGHLGGVKILLLPTAFHWGWDSSRGLQVRAPLPVPPLLGPVAQRTEQSPCDILPRMNPGTSLSGCAQEIPLAPRFVDSVPSQTERPDHGPCHAATTPLDGRYLESPLVDVQGPVDIRLRLPAAGASIETPVSSVGGCDFPTSVAGDRSFSLLHLVDLDAHEGPFVPQDLHQFAVRPGVESLV